jgi:predicted DNA-binding transcriptional regulator AlpA
MQPRYLKKSDLVTRRAGKKTNKPERRGRYPFSSSTLWRLIKAGRFPEPVIIAGIKCWPLDVLEEWERRQEGAA